jgi:hypothetical protein
MGIAWLFGTRRTPEEELAAVRDCLRSLARSLEREAERADEASIKAAKAARESFDAKRDPEATQHTRAELAYRQQALRCRGIKLQLEQQNMATTTQTAQLGMQQALTRSTRAMTRALGALPPAIFAQTLMQHGLVSQQLTARQGEMVSEMGTANETADDELDDEVGEGKEDMDAQLEARLAELKAQRDHEEQEVLLAQFPATLRTPKKKQTAASSVPRI